MLVLRFISLSIVVHLVLYTGILLAPAALMPLPRPDVTEIEILQKPFKEDGKQVVREALAPEKLKIEDNSDARFFSQQRQRVLIETKAEKTGLTQNANPNAPKTAKVENRKNRDLSGYEPIQLPKPQDIITEGDSTVGESLPTDVSVGTFTALNTDAFTFYSFYARIEELVRFRWETQVREVIDGYDQAVVLRNLGRKNWITQVEFLISPDGHLKVSRVMKPSGMKGFDMAAVQAFRDARYFPNPPQELVEADGFVHLKYSFNVYFEPSALANRN